jgi:phage-related protein
MNTFEVHESDAPYRTYREKEVRWCEPNLRHIIKGWPEQARWEIGDQLREVQYGKQPSDFKPMPSIGIGVYEIRCSESGDQYRLIYVAKFIEAIWVIHLTTKKKTQRTSKRDIEIAKRRYRNLVEERKGQTYR